MKSILLLILFLPTYLYSQENLSITGTYKLGDDINIENVGEILVVPKANNQAIIYISTSKKAPSYNTFSLLTEVDLLDNKAYYQPKTGSGKLGFLFSKNSVRIIDSSAITMSHFSIHNKEFNKISDTSPVYFTRGDGLNIELNENVDDFETNYYPNTSLFDFIGVWQYSQGSEALNISKNLTNDSIKIQYNSVFDGYEDRFFENCKFINGKIIGDYYGGKENVILVINEGDLLLTIDPFHEFQPIKKQLFKNKPEAIFKYCSQNENTYIKNGNQKVDSLPPGDRVLVGVEIESKDYFSLLYYNSRFNKTPHNQKINRYILPKQLSDIKPLFISEDVNLEFFKNYNESELFVQTLYAPEKLKENIRIVSVPEQNRAGQKKLFIDNEVYSKLGLQNIKMYYDNLFITGTVDLSREFRSVTVDFQSDYEYYTYLINYDMNGKYIDHILISRNDYVESMTAIKSVFAPGEIYVNSLLQHWVEDGVDIGNSYYQTFETVRYVINQKGQFMASNYATSFMHEPELSFRVVTQQVESKTYGNALLSLYQNYIDTTYAGGYVISMHTKIETEKGMEFIIPMDFSSVAGFYSPPYGDFIGPFGALQKLFYTYHTDDLERLRISFTLKDMNNDGLDDLNMKIVDANYVVEPEEEILFIQKGSEWVLHKN